ncbi:hypothetical protein L2E82_37551 [Cichorium intybus]|uniref:Uncharacterized protein n=1 Tax=Cichorium intybus TaxID=13427 RepID=A0ACB9AF91_CICIN|nr:hypothetical protein L2E82_37551 [Cichorium intybus]
MKNTNEVQISKNGAMCGCYWVEPVLIEDRLRCATLEVQTPEKVDGVAMVAVMVCAVGVKAGRKGLRGVKGVNGTAPPSWILGEEPLLGVLLVAEFDLNFSHKPQLGFDFETDEFDLSGLSRFHYLDFNNGISKLEAVLDCFKFFQYFKVSRHR